MHVNSRARQMSTHSIKSTQFVSQLKSSILEHIRFHEANKFKTLKSNEQIDDHIDMPVEKLHMCMKCAYLITILIFWKKWLGKFLLQEKYEDGFPKFWEKIGIEKYKISSDQIEKMENNCENAWMNDKPLFLDELYKGECNHSSRRTYIEDLKFRVSFEKNLIWVFSLSMSQPMIKLLKI